VQVALELGGGITGTGRFRGDGPKRDNQESVDASVNFGAFVGSRRQIYGLVLERTWIGRDHYGAVSDNVTTNANYLIDTLWVSGRWYLADARPAIYLGAAIGPAIPRTRATGTQPSDLPLVSPPVSFECSESGKVGLGLAGVVGAEFDVADQWSFLADARIAGHVLSQSADQFNRCAPATGSTLGGTARLAVQFRFGG
jgi:hypothetical protein